MHRGDVFLPATLIRWMSAAPCSRVADDISDELKCNTVYNA